MPAPDGRDELLLGHLLSLRAVAQAQLANIDACIRAVASPEEAKAAAEAAAAACRHPRKTTYQTAGSTTVTWSCPDCGAKGEMPS